MSSSSAKKILLVFGATGKQGGSVVSSILGDAKAAEIFQIRGVTRDASKPNAKALEAKGVQVVEASLDDAASIQKVMQNVFGVFVVTDYWASMDAKKEIQQGKNVVDAAKQAGVQHLVLSVLKNVNELTGGKYPNVYHFDSKAKIGDYARESGVPTTYFMPGFYMDNFFQSIIPAGDGWIYVAPYSKETPIPLFDAEADTGLFVKSILLNRSQTLGKNVLGATKYYTPSEIISEFAKAKPETGSNLQFVQVSGEQFKDTLKGYGMPEFGAQELLENMMFMEPFGYYGKESLDWSHSLLDGKPTTFEQFARNAEKWKSLQ